jgi:hypothetical protein
MAKPKKKKRSRPSIYQPGLTRKARLRRARKWLADYAGEKIFKDYLDRYAVDQLCAAIELQQLGVKHPRVEQLCTRLEARRERRKLCRAEERIARIAEAKLPEQDENFAFIAGYTSGGAPFGITWDECHDEVDQPSLADCDEPLPTKNRPR